MKLKQLSAPSLPVTLDEARSFYRVIGTEQDDDILRTLHAAVDRAEQVTNLQLSLVQYAGYLDAFERTVKLPKPPTVSVDKVEYIAADGTTKEWNDYELDNVSLPSFLHFWSLPDDVRQSRVNNVIVTFTTGYDQIPEDIKSWLLIYGLTLFEHREGIVEGTIVSDDKARYFDNLLSSHRIIP